MVQAIGDVVIIKHVTAPVEEEEPKRAKEEPA
jgi:hypothetical protein